jgi:UTP--glucose-1-phosphate uridylyltransferase
VPKELFPIGTVPVIDFLMSELRANGFDEIVVVTSPKKEILTTHLENEWLGGEGFARIHFVEQEEQLGTAHALQIAAPAVAGRGCLVAYPDDIVRDAALVGAMVEDHLSTGKAIVALRAVPAQELHAYGVVAVGRHLGRALEIRDIVEKPSGEPPSNLAVLGRYVLDRAGLDLLAGIEPSARGEAELTTALKTLAEEERLLGIEYTGACWDIGTPMRLLKAQIAWALEEHGEIDWLRADLEREVTPARTSP